MIAHPEDVLLAVLAADLSSNEVDAFIDTMERSCLDVGREYGVSSQMVSQWASRARRKIAAAVGLAVAA